MDPLPAHLLRLWAKLPREPMKPRPYHPLICHLIDVAMVTRVMWRQVVSPAVRRWIADSLSLTEEDAERWIVFLAGSHDIGKASPAFALKDDFMGRRVIEAGLPPPDLRVTTPPHGTVSAYALSEILPSTYGVRPLVAQRLAAAIGGHHGIIPGDFNYDGQAITIDGAGQPQWQEARLALLQVLASVADGPGDAVPDQLANAPALWLAGLISVADWIGSNTMYFTYAAPDDTVLPQIDLVDYVVEASNKARSALAELGWSMWSAPQEALPFASLFSINGAPMAPRPLQRAVIALAEQLTEPSLVIIEAPMGEGKTEAAMYLADHNNGVLGQSGCYFALPTQATSNQMFGRVKAFLAHRYPAELVNLQLLHGHAALSEQFEELRRSGDRLFQLRSVYGYGGDDRHAAVAAAEWFTYRKRGLLAPFGVGTVDQVLLAALSTPHVFVRLFGLARKTIIVDEVHAYDTYMTTLLERLLEWLGALGSSVIVLSATLPKDRRNILLNTYRKGRGQPEAELPRTRYPRLTWAGATTDAVHVPTVPRPPQPVQLNWIDGSLPSSQYSVFDFGLQLGRALGGGGCAAVICNTVGRAQKMHTALCRCFEAIPAADRPDLHLLHARYPFGERERREKQVLDLFGKPGESVHRPHRAVLVATQIIEQSLDLDFDLLVTDFAPADLILQRIGRLHRHDRPYRPAALRLPTVWICEPERMEGEVPRFERGTEAVYDDDHVLLRSWLTLRHSGRSSLSIPDDVEEVIEEVYDDRTCPSTLSAAMRARWDETREKQCKAVDHDKAQAKDRYIRRPGGLTDLSVLASKPREEDAPDLHQAHQALTRLAQPSVMVICLYGSREQPCFDPDLKYRAPVKGNLTQEQIKQLLQRSVVISDPRLVWELAKEPVPAGWEQSALLRHCRPFILDESGRPTQRRFRCYLDDQLGLVIGNSDNENEQEVQ